MVRFLLASVITAWSSFASSFEATPYIVNGTTANISNYPTFASLFYRSNTLYSTSSFCGATLINSEYVLTAAHCIYGQNETMLYTVVAPQLEDESRFLSSPQARVVEFYYPDTYSDSSVDLWRDDIAILKLETALGVGDFKYLLNTTINNSFPSNGEFIAVGHGYTEGNQPGGGLLLETELEYISTSACRAEFGSAITDKHLCFGGPEKSGYQNSTCSGDSGGPVYYYNGLDYIQVGLTSFGPALCGDNRYSVTSVFTDLYDYQGWIDQVLAGEVEPKAFVLVEDGVRRLINNEHGSSQAEVTPDQLTTSSSGGGGVFYGLLVLLLIAFKRSIKW